MATIFGKLASRWNIILFDPYLVLNYLTIFVYLISRYTVLDSSPIFDHTLFGLNYETWSMILLTFYGQFKYRTTYYIDDFLESMIPLLRICILFVMYFIHIRVMGWFLIAFVCFAILTKRRLYSGPSKVITLQYQEFVDYIEADDSSDVLHIILFYSLRSKKSSRFRREFTELSIEFTHSDATKFYSVDIDRQPEFISDFNIKNDTFSNELPVVAGIYRGEYYKIGRLPPFEDVKDVKDVQDAEEIDDAKDSKGSKDSKEQKKDDKTKMEGTSKENQNITKRTQKDSKKNKKSLSSQSNKPSSSPAIKEGGKLSMLNSFLSTPQEAVTAGSIVREFELRERLATAKRRDKRVQEMEEIIRQESEKQSLASRLQELD